jgi:hypothetical protein
MLPRFPVAWLMLTASLIFGSFIGLGAVANWASSEALGDVAVAFTNEIRIFDNADGTETDAITTTTAPALAGTNAGLAFDASLNLLVANTDFSGNGRLVTLSPLAPHGQLGATATQPSPRALALAADGTTYVASLGGTIRRYTPAGALSGTFTIPAESTTCIGIDLAPDQDTLFAVTGGRTVLRVMGVRTASGPASTTTFASLPNPGTACGLRLLAPVDVRATPAPLAVSPMVGGIIVADTRTIKRLDWAGVVRETFNAGSEPDSKKNWVDVALDPNTRDFWGVDAGLWRLAKFRIGGAATALPLIQLAGMPRGVAVNGELRAAQTVQLVNLTANVEGTASFLQGTPSQHSWKGTLPVNASLAIQAFEVTFSASVDQPDPTTQLCPPSLNVHCRLFNFGDAVPKVYSRGRSVVVREILRAPVPQDLIFRVGLIFPGATDISAGEECTVGGIPKSGSAFLRDPWPHDLFSLDGTLVFFGGDDGVYTRTRTNDSILVDRGDARYFLRILDPAEGTTAQSGRTMPVSLEAEDPLAGCNPVAGLEGMLALSVTDITVGPDKGLLLGDSQNIIAPVISNGLIWASVAGTYRTNLDIDSRYQPNHTYRLCIAAPAGLTGDQVPAAGEVCRDFDVK